MEEIKEHTGEELNLSQSLPRPRNYSIFHSRARPSGDPDLAYRTLVGSPLRETISKCPWLKPSANWDPIADERKRLAAQKQQNEKQRKREAR